MEANQGCKLAWGLTKAIPAGTQVYWGARWIFPDDMLHDRQDFMGIDTEDGIKLRHWLSHGALAKAKKAARECNLGACENRTITLYEDSEGIVKGDPCGSYGYLYVCAYLKGDKP